MSRLISVVLLGALAALAGCFGPNLAAVQCGQDGLCPVGLVCDLGRQVCVEPGSIVADASPPDAAADRDSDGVVDGADNCPDIGNPEQFDEDGDAVGDLCDNCPGHANADQADELEADNGEPADGVGDACDPRPDRPGDVVRFFDGFNGSLDAWTVVRGGDTWSLSNGAVSQSSTAPGFSGLAWTGGELDRATIITRASAIELLDEQGAEDDIRSVGVIAQYDPELSNEGRGYSCTRYYDPSAGANTTSALLVILLNTPIVAGSDAVEALAVGDSIEYALDVDGTAPSQTCRTVGDGPTSIADNDNRFTSGQVGLRTNGASAAFDFALIVEHGE